MFSKDCDGEVLRRLSEFNSLYRKLDKKYSNSGILVPPPPRITTNSILSNKREVWKEMAGKNSIKFSIIFSFLNFR